MNTKPGKAITTQDETSTRQANNNTRHEKKHQEYKPCMVRRDKAGQTKQRNTTTTRNYDNKTQYQTLQYTKTSQDKTPQEQYNTSQYYTIPDNRKTIMG